jgi:hypothetical protein
MPPRRRHDPSRRAHLHFNPLQEAVQDAGDTNLDRHCKEDRRSLQKIEVPVIAKEVGWGISERTAKLLPIAACKPLTWQAQAARAGLKWKCTARPMNSPVNSRPRSSAGESQQQNPF